MTRSACYHQIREILSGFDPARSAAEARFLLWAIAGIDSNELLLHGEVLLDEKHCTQLMRAAEKRSTGYPLQYAAGKTEFMGIPLIVGEGVLIPRMDTEFAVEKALEFLSKVNQPTVADLCSGTGCIALAIEKNIPQSEVYAVEYHPQALSYLVQNLALHHSKIHPIHADVLDVSCAKRLPLCDLIISNPPYIDHDETPLMGKDVLTFEPKTALFAEQNGLLFYRTIAKHYFSLLKPGGRIVFEIGFSQGEAVTQILQREGYSDIRIQKDFDANDRVISACKTE